MLMNSRVIEIQIKISIKVEYNCKYWKMEINKRKPGVSNRFTNESQGICRQYDQIFCHYFYLMINGETTC